MHFDFLDIPVKSLAKLSFFMAKRPKEPKIFWRDIIGDAKKLQHIGIENPAPFVRFSKLLDQLIGDYSNFTLLRLLERIINRSGLLAFILKQTDKTWQLQAVNTFFEFVKKETDKKPRFTLKKLLDIFSNMDANRLPIGILKTITAKEGVNLVTAHSSKGLEFRFVFLIDCVKENWEPKGSGNIFRFPFPDTLTLSGEEDALEARRRLFYVAMTRAQEQLQFSFSQTDINGKPLNRALYVDEILEEANLDVQTATLTETVLAEAQALQLQEIEKPVITAAEKDVVDALLEGFTMSVSSLNRYLRCPLSFYYESVLILPAAQSEAASYGLAMHYALHKFFEKRKLSKSKMLPLKKDLLSYFQGDMNRQRAYFTAKEFDRRSQLGKLHLEKYYDLNQSSWPKKIKTEYSIRNVELQGVPLTGTIDRIDFIDDFNAHVVDYKTGSIDSKKTTRPKDSNPIGGLYWRQLVFYKILFELHQQTHKIHSAEIAYLEADNKNNYVRKNLEINVNDVETVKELITNSYQKILNHDFYEGCGEPHCQWCNFAKQNILADSFTDLEAEDLDD
jgi:DNA helicase-2/ATP-dependent DNA helicase PcrA